MAQISYDTLTITNIPDNLRQNFWVETTNYSSQIPAGVYITQNSASSFKNNPSGPNIFMQATNDNNGIRLRQGLLTLAEIMSDRFRLYTPNGSTQGLLGLSLDATDGLVLYRTNNAAVEKSLQLSSAGLEIFGSSQSTADVTVNSSGINIGNGKITGGTVGTTTQYEPDDNFIYLSTHEYGSTLRVGTFSKTNWQLVVGKNFGVTSSGDVYAYNATTTGRIIADRGKIGGTLDDNNGWYILAGRLYTGTIGAVNSLHMRTSDLDDAVTINGQSRTDWRLTIGDKFGVTSDGYLYADGLNITNISVGTITISDVSGLQNSLTYAQNNADYYFDDIANGVAVHNYTNTTQPDNRIEITSTNGLEIFNGGVSVAKYSTTARIGQVANDKSRVEITEKGIKFYNRTSGTDVVLAHIGYDAGIAESGSTSTSKYPYYTFGIRASNTSSTRGNYSVAEGVNTTASGYASHAEGGYTTAGGMHAHTEGFQTTTNGVTAHAEGNWSKANGHASHAEGCYTTASGDYSHTEGYKTFARSDCAHSNGYEVRADGKYSSVCGKYNSEDASCFTRTTDTSVQTNKIYYYKYANNRYEVVANPINTELWMYYELTGDGEYAFIIGNGTSTVDRSNALTVDWNGNIKAGGLDCGVVSITPTAGSVTSKKVTFNHTFSSPPYVVATAESSVPGTVVSEVSVGSITTTGFTMYILRSNNTSTNINWIAMYCG